MPLDELLPKAMSLWPTKRATVCGNVRMNYKTFGRRVFSLCNALKRLGLKLTEGYQIIPEQSTTAMIVYNDEAEY